MIFIIRQKIHYFLNNVLNWYGKLILGIIMLAFALLLCLLAIVVITPIHIEIIKSFGTLGLLLLCITFALLGSFWVWQGFVHAYKLISWKDQATTEKIRSLIFKKSEKKLPSVVALGGGTGLSTLLKGLKELNVDITAIVTVTDDGGSSGRLRKDLQILPPGDIRNCLVALAPSESLMSRLFQYRFDEGGEIAGHSFGNLFIAAMTGLLGDFGTAVREANNILAIKGQVIPVTLENVDLEATFTDGTKIRGETSISQANKKIKKINLSPPNPLPNAEALHAIDKANVIILGPGSLFTSVIPNLLVSEIAERINKSKAKVVYICNVMTQPGETDKFSAADHVTALLEHTNLKRIDIAIVNSRRVAKKLLQKYEAQGQYWVPPTVTKIESFGIKVVTGDFLSETDLVRHDSKALANTINELLSEV